MMTTRSGLKVKNLRLDLKNQKKRIAKLNRRLKARELSPPSPIQDFGTSLNNRTEPPTPEEVTEAPKVLHYKKHSFQPAKPPSNTPIIPIEPSLSHKKTFKEIPSPYSTSIKSCVFDRVEIDTPSQSFYPSALVTGNKVHICEICFKYFNDFGTLVHHRTSCTPHTYFKKEDIVYQTENFQIYEILGSSQTLFCQCLCLFTRLFLTSKALCYDINLFKFYILRHRQDKSKLFKTVGYFSKEIRPKLNLNLSCIFIFPNHQGKSFGKLLIQFSYELSKIEKVIGTPERPLSDSGLCTYLKFWSSSILDVLLNIEGSITISELSKVTYIHPMDIVLALEYLDLKDNLINPITVNTNTTTESEGELNRVEDHSLKALDTSILHQKLISKNLSKSTWIEKEKILKQNNINLEN